MLRGRKVYDLITLVSEVSGLADIFFVTVSFLLGVFYTPFLLKAALLKHMGPVILPKYARTSPECLNKRGVYDLMRELSGRITLNLSIWLLIFQKIIPYWLRSAKANKLLDLVE
jgi:hypothetical protein